MSAASNEKNNSGMGSGQLLAIVGVLAALVAIALTVYLEWNRIWISGLQVPAGIEYKAVPGGPPPSYRDQVIITNISDQILEEVKCIIQNPDSGKKLEIIVGEIPAKEAITIDNFNAPELPYGVDPDSLYRRLPQGYEIDPKDSITVDAKGFLPRSVSLKQLGMEKRVSESVPPQ